MRIFKLRKLISSLLIVLSAAAINPVAANAEWRSDSTGWWYADGSSWYTGWKNIDGKWYYFDNNGYMAHDRYVDSYYLNSEGCLDENSFSSTVSSTLEGVSVKYPSTWKKVTKDGFTGYIMDSNGTNVIVASESMYGMTIKNYLDANANNIKKNIGISQINTSTQVINGKTVDVLDYEDSNSGYPVQIHQVIFYNNNKAYIFSLTKGKDIPSADILASFNDMLKTVTF